MSCYKEFENANLALLSHFPFYGALLAQCKIKLNDKCQTAYVTILSTGDIEMGISPKFFLSLKAEHRVGLILHELNHLMLRHLHRTKSLGLNPKLANIAQDIELNQYIPESLLPEGALLPSTFKLPEGLNFEKYYVLLAEKAEKNKQNGGKGQGKGQGEGQGSGDEHSIEIESYETLDNHEMNVDASGDKKDEKQAGGSVGEMQSQEAAADVINKAIKNARAKAGNMPAHIERVLEDLNKKTEVPWQQLLKKFVGRNISATMESTRTRANRRVGLMAEGYKNEYTPKILIGVDQSGSVDDEMLEQFVAEMKKIVGAANDKVTIAFFDTEVSNTVKITDAKKVPKKRVRSGGTDFNAIVNLARKDRPDLLIIMTDGEAPNPDKVARLPLLWAIVPNSSDSDLSEFSDLVGQKIKIDLTEKKKAG